MTSRYHSKLFNSFQKKLVPLIPNSMRWLSPVLYYLFIFPISILPYPLLYALSDISFYTMFYGFGYRRKVVRLNLERSFPSMSSEQIHEIERKFFRHLMDLIFESFKIFTITRDEVIKRVFYKNPEVVNTFFDRGQSVIIATGHYNNWEMIAASLDIPLKHQTFGIYTKLSNPYFDQKMKDTRSRFGMKLITTKETKQSFAETKESLTAFVFGFDQSPSPASNPHWITFLNQDTPAQFGTEKYAKEYNRPVVYGRMKKLKRGFYDFEFEEVCLTPAASAHGEITEKINRMLEQDITKQPEFWLWSHKRWKLKRHQPVECITI